GGDPVRCQDALALLGGAGAVGAGPGPDDPPEVQRARAAVLAREPGRPRRKEAIRLLEDLADRAAAVPDDGLLLAQLYDDDGNWPRAREAFAALVAAADTNPLYL